MADEQNSDGLAYRLRGQWIGNHWQSRMQLVGNPDDAAGLELPLAGAELQVSGGPVLLSVCGPDATLEIDGRSIPHLTSGIARNGEHVSVGPPRGGVYAYLAVAGGFQTKSDLGSQSFHRRSGIGGVPLAKGIRLPCDHRPIDEQMTCYQGQIVPEDAYIRFVPGPQFDFFSTEVRALFQSSEFRVRSMSDRMGIRLDGPSLLTDKPHDILSEGVVAGSVQVPGNGNPIVLGRDCQTTGGYPKIATIISADLDRLYQMPAGRIFRFAAVTLADAIKAAREAADWRASIRLAIQPTGQSLKDLLSHNLIGGVTRGDDV